jgi:hypothetical protein
MYPPSGFWLNALWTGAIDHPTLVTGDLAAQGTRNKCA